MKKVRRRSSLLISPLALAASGASAHGQAHAAGPDEIAYRVAMPDPRTHEFEVEMAVPALPERASAEIVFPAWAPGSYLVRDFVRHVYGLAVTDARGKPLPAERLDKQRWRVVSGGRPFRVRYRVFAFEASVRTSYLDDAHGYFNGTSVFFYVDGELHRPCRLEVVPPPRRAPAWQVATALPPVKGARYAFRAADYDELVDSPVEVGTHETLSFRTGGTVFEVALYGRTNADRPRLLGDLKKVVEAAGAMFGGFPFERYLFIVHALPVATGGLEHRASVTMDVAGLGFEDESGYRSFAGLAAHEFFHAWNVKRIHDTVLGPFDYTKENYTRLLWLHEGFTDAMSRFVLLRAGVLKSKDFLKWLGDEWPRYAARPGRNETPLADLSFEAWIKEYKPADNHTNAAVSYYQKGMWAGFTLDLMLRQASGGAHGLPDLFRRLWDDFGKTGRGLTEADVRAAASALAGAPMDAFFDRYVRGTDELPLPKLLRASGFDVREPAPWDPPEEAPAPAVETPADDKPDADAPPRPPEPERDAVKERRLRAWSGVTLAPARKGGPAAALVRNVVPGSPAFEAGLTYNDEIVAVEGTRVDAESFARRIADRAPGETARVAYFRGDQLREARLKLVESPERRLVVKPDPKADKKAAAIRKGWIGE